MALAKSISAILLFTSVSTITAAVRTPTKSDIDSKKILVILPLASPSHHNLFSALTNALLDRGHYVTIVSAGAQKAKHPRFREILIRDPVESFLANLTKENLKAPQGIFQSIMMMFLYGHLFTDPVFESPKAMALKNENFDLLITEAFFFQEPLLGFAHHFKCPSVILNPIGYMHHLNYFTGGAVNPAYVPNSLGSGMQPETFLDRLSNTISSLLWMLTYQFKYLPEADAALHKIFPDAPPIRELIKNISLTLINNNNALMDPVPLAPSVIEVGGIHIKPGKPLPADLQKWIEESNDGIVYFSFGSNIQTGLIPDDKRMMLFESFGKLKQRVLLKWNAEIPADAPKNCRFEVWVPQQEVLAHPKLKVFVTHGGLLSTQESVYYGAALVAMPVFGDQYSNAAMAAKQGFARQVSIQDLTTEILDAALDEVINNPKYRERSKQLSLLFRLDAMAPLEKAVYYTEQLMKLGNFKHLQPSSVNLHWYQYMLLDVLAVIVLGLYIAWRLIRCVSSIILGCFCKASKDKKD